MLTTLQKWLLGVFIGLPATLYYGFFCSIATLFAFHEIADLVKAKTYESVTLINAVMPLVMGVGGLSGLLAFWLFVLTPHTKLQKSKVLSRSIYFLLCLALLASAGSALLIWFAVTSRTMTRVADMWTSPNALINLFVLGLLPTLLAFLGFFLLKRQLRRTASQ